MIQRPKTFIYKSAYMIQTAKKFECPVAWYETEFINRDLVLTTCGGPEWSKYIHILCMIHGPMRMEKVKHDIVDKLQSNHRIKLDDPNEQIFSKVSFTILCLKHMETVAAINSFRYREHMRLITLTCYTGVSSKLHRGYGVWEPKLYSIYSTNSYAGYLKGVGSSVGINELYQMGIVVITESSIVGEIANDMLTIQINSCHGKHRMCIIYIDSEKEFYAIKPSDYVISNYTCTDVSQGVLAFNAIYTNTQNQQRVNQPVTIDNIINAMTPDSKKMFSVERKLYNGDLLNDPILKLSFVTRLDYVRIE